jgi:hypothetical protein
MQDQDQLPNTTMPDVYEEWTRQGWHRTVFTLSMVQSTT